MFTIATWNVNSLRVRLPQLLDWLARVQPDIVALQETKTVDATFPLTEIQQAGYHAIFAGQKTYNGVALLSRMTGTEIVTELPNYPDSQRRVLAVTYPNGLRVLNLYVPNGSSVDSDKYHYKLAWLNALQAYVADSLQRYSSFCVLGDFNIAPTDADVHDPQAWEGGVLVSPAERLALQNLMALGLQDTFRLFEQSPESFSWWDYRAAGFRRNHGVRIDLILANAALAQCCQACHIDKEPRRLERPSDHTPVVATFAL
ncbi:exodeoxyribonuclease III [Beggiatoa leptomitoformis]|uniref:Exodeoxyribonuclease III n=1 Tax=Beggiatoa leptomitoformis TaxID=288004 RepID=A0A2N9YA17_9GAMM|nr:exodeoxyribonuclease III [Beggiatoa leptomitoformis]ALG67268.1 exodeoxyribonuclease III [Beggiatoa leptomitoformis]AUI67307.1 exodeoxyribonuclease III [Beggiatoa leptomitoformis]